jgi:hypothetical protein
VQVVGGAEACEITEVVIEVRLIEIPTRERHFRPVHVTAAVHSAEHRIEATETTERLRCQADLRMEAPEQAVPGKPAFSTTSVTRRAPLDRSNSASA